MENSFKIFIVVSVIIFIMTYCADSSIISKDDILAIKVYKASSKVDTDTFPVYKEIAEKKDTDKFVSILNEGEKNRIFYWFLIII